MLRSGSLFFFIIILLSANAAADDPHPRAAKVPEGITRNLKSNPVKYFPLLVGYLAEGAADEEEKVRIFHDWIALNIKYDTEGFFSGQIESASEYDVLTTGKSVCQGYSDLFKSMCDLEDISCIVIPGYGRGFGFSIFGGAEKFNSNHAWNAVRLGGKWHLIDVTWDAGYVDERSFKPRYSTGYFKLAANKFIITHYPEEEKYQFLDKPLSFEQFREQPYLLDGFFSSGFELISKLKLQNKVSSEVELKFKAPRNIAVMGSIYNNRGEEFRKRVFIRQSGEDITMYCTFPSQGDYEFVLFAGVDKNSDQYEGIMKAGFSASAGSEKEFPEVYEEMKLCNAAIIEPIFSPLREGSEQAFTLKAEKGLELGLFFSGAFHPLKHSGDGFYKGNIQVPSGEVVLCRKSGTLLTFLCKWEVR